MLLDTRGNGALVNRAAECLATLSPGVMWKPANISTELSDLAKENSRQDAEGWLLLAAYRKTEEKRERMKVGLSVKREPRITASENSQTFKVANDARIQEVDSKQDQFRAVSMNHAIKVKLEG